MKVFIFALLFFAILIGGNILFHHFNDTVIYIGEDNESLEYYHDLCEEKCIGYPHSGSYSCCMRVSCYCWRWITPRSRC